MGAGAEAGPAPLGASALMLQRSTDMLLTNTGGGEGAAHEFVWGRGCWDSSWNCQPLHLP